MKEILKIPISLIKKFFSVPIWVYVISFLGAEAMFLILGPLKQLPSPIFGGDFYHYLGYLHHVYYGGNPLDSPILLDEIPIVPPLFYILIYVFGKIFSLSMMKANIFISIPLVIVFPIIGYHLAKNFTSNKIYLVAAILFSLNGYPIFKYTDFAIHSFSLLLGLATIYFYNNRTFSSKIIFGTVLGIGGLLNTQLFFSELILLGVITAFEIYEKIKDEEGIAKSINAVIIELSPIYILFILLSLIYWFKPIFVYHGNAINKIHIYSAPDLNDFGTMLEYVFRPWTTRIIGPDFLKDLFWIIIFLSVLLKIKETQNRVLIIFLISAVIASLHPLVTWPILHLQFWANRMTSMLIPPLAIAGISTSKELIRKVLKNKYLINGFSIFILGLVLYIVVSTTYQIMSSVYFSAALKTGINPVFEELSKWIINNTSVYDVFVSTKETGFAINALTGRKFVTSRWPHVSPYADVEQRDIASAIILYGNNDEEREKMLKKYKVKYLVWATNWISDEYRMTPEGKISHTFDPLIAYDTPKNREYLTKNGIKYIPMYRWVDPAYVKNFPKFNLLYILPSEFRIFHPWNKKLDKYLEVEKVVYISENGQDIPAAIIFRVVY